MNTASLRAGAGAAILTVLLAAPTAKADVLMPGTKGVDHAYVFSGVADHPEFDFYLVLPPMWRESHGTAKIEDGAELRFYKLLEARVRAAPKGAEFDLVTADWEAMPRSDQAFSLYGSAPDTSPIHRRVTALRIDAVDGDRVVVTDLGTVEYDRAGQRLSAEPVAVATRNLAGPIGLSAGAAALLAGFWLLRRRRRAVLAS